MQGPVVQIIAQIIGIVAMAVCVSSFQFKNNKRFFIVQGVSSCLFFTHFFLLGAYTGAFLNLLGLVRSTCLSIKKLRHPVFEVLIMAIYTLITVLTYDGWLSILVLAAQLIGTAVFWRNKAMLIRIYQLAIGSPFWLVYNIFNFSIGGIVTEVFNLISTTVSIIRYRKTGFDES